MGAAAGARVRAVEGELVGTQPHVVSQPVEPGRRVGQLGPAGRGGDVDLDHAGVRRHGGRPDPRVTWQRIPFQHNGYAASSRRLLDRRQQLERRLRLVQRRQEDEDVTVALLDAQGRRRSHPDRRDLGPRRRPRQPPPARRPSGGAAAGGAARPSSAAPVAPGPGGPRDRGDRQPQARRRGARDQHHPPATRGPARRGPGGAVGRPVQRQRPAGRPAGLGVQPGHQPSACLGVGQPDRRRVDVHGRRVALRSPGLVHDPDERVLEQRSRELRWYAERLGDRGDDGRHLVGRLGRARRQRPAAPRGRRAARGHARSARRRPATRRRPASAATVLPGYHLPCPWVSTPPASASSTSSRRASAWRPGPLVGAVGRDVPLRAVHVVDRDEGRLAAHREPDVARLECRSTTAAEQVDALELVRRVGRGHPRVLVHPADDVVELHRRLGRVGPAGDRRRLGRLRRRRQRDVALARQQPGRGVEPDPARAGQEDLGPGVQVGEVLGQARHALARRRRVGHQLDQVAGDEAGRQAELAQRRRRAARPSPGTSRWPGPASRRGSAPPAPSAPCSARRGSSCWLSRTRKSTVRSPSPGPGRGRRSSPGRRRRRPGLGQQVGREVRPQRRLVAERHGLGVLLEEEVERVDDRHLGDQVDDDVQLGGALREDQPGQVVAVGVLLPVDEVARPAGPAASTP